MPNVLIADGTPAAWQAERAGFGIPSNFPFLPRRFSCITLVSAQRPSTSPTARACPLVQRFRTSMA